MHRLLETPLFKDDIHEGDHYRLLMQSIIEIYVNTRFFYIAKKATEKISMRNQLTREIHFRHM